MRPDLPAVSFSTDGVFAHCTPPAVEFLTMSVCCNCGAYVCASPNQPLIAFVEGLHRCHS